MAKMPPEERVRIYKAGAGSANLFSSLATAGEELYLSRYIIWRIFTRDFAVQFRQRLLGYFWAVLNPLLSVVSFIFMYQTGILNPGEVKVPYAVFVFFGNSLWGIMIGAFTNVSSGLLGNAELLLRTSIPKFALAIAGLANLAYAILVQLVILGILLVVFGVVPSWGILLYPIMALPLIILGIGLGLILAVIGTVARDITNMASTVLGLVMYITPVIYVTDFDSPILKAVVRYNPLTYVFKMSRNMAFEGDFTQWGGFVLAWLFSLVVFVLGIHGFYLIKDKVAERL